MKRITIKSYLLACVVLPMILAGCEDADYRVIDNAIYLNEASENGSAKVTVDPENVTTKEIFDQYFYAKKAETATRFPPFLLPSKRLTAFRIHFNLIQFPDIIDIFLNGSVRREFTTVCNI